MQVLILSNQHSERKSVVILGNHLFFIDPQNVTAFHFKSELELDLLFQFAPYPEFLTGENIELICNAYLKNCNEYPNEANRLFSDEDIDMNRRVIAHSTKNHWVMRKLMALKDLRVIKILMERSDIEESFKDELLSLLINIKPDGDVIKYIAQYSRSAVVIEKLLSQDYACNEMMSVLKHIVTNKNLPKDLYTKVYHCFIKLSSLPDYHLYEMSMRLRYLYSDFLGNEAVPDCLIEMMLLSNISVFTPNDKLQKILLRKNLPQYILEYILNSFDNKAIKNVYYDIQARTRILNFKHRLKHSN